MYVAKKLILPMLAGCHILWSIPGWNVGGIHASFSAIKNVMLTNEATEKSLHVYSNGCTCTTFTDLLDQVGTQSFVESTKTFVPVVWVIQLYLIPHSDFTTIARAQQNTIVGIVRMLIVPFGS